MSITDHPAETSVKPRTWLAGVGGNREPGDRPAVRDDQLHVWEAGDDGLYHWGHHHLRWTDLRVRTDLVEAL